MVRRPRRQRRLLGRLPHHGVAAHQRERGVPRPHGDRKVERGNDPAYTIRMPRFEHAMVRTLRRDRARDAARPRAQIDRERPPRAAGQEVQRPRGEKLRFGAGHHGVGGDPHRDVPERLAAEDVLQRLALHAAPQRGHVPPGLRRLQRPPRLGAQRAVRDPEGPGQQPLGIHGRTLHARAPQRVGPEGEGRLDARPRADQRVRIHGASHDSTFCSRSACSAAASASTISSRSPSRIAGRRCSVSPIR